MPGGADPSGTETYTCECTCRTGMSGGSFPPTKSEVSVEACGWGSASKACKKACKDLGGRSGEGYATSCTVCSGDVKDEPKTEDVWVCTRWFSSWFGIRLRHQYVCCDGPNKNCKAHRDNDVNRLDPVQSEVNPTGTCVKKKVSARYKNLICGKNPLYPKDGSTCNWNCRAYANCGIDDFGDDHPGKYDD